MPELYWEDFEVGQTLEYGGHTVTKDEIVAFARDFDPQVFHLDEEAAKDHFFGGLIASGWQTAGFTMRMMVDGYLCRSSSQGSPGVAELRWMVPVRPGDTLRVRQTILSTRASKSRPTIGLIECRFETLNQHDEVVLAMRSTGMFGRRTPANAGDSPEDGA